MGIHVGSSTFDPDWQKRFINKNQQQSKQAFFTTKCPHQSSRCSCEGFARCRHFLQFWAFSAKFSRYSSIGTYMILVKDWMVTWNRSQIFSRFCVQSGYTAAVANEPFSHSLFLFRVFFSEWCHSSTLASGRRVSICFLIYVLYSTYVYIYTHIEDIHTNCPML